MAYMTNTYDPNVWNVVSENIPIGKIRKTDKLGKIVFEADLFGGNFLPGPFYTKKDAFEAIEKAFKESSSK